MLVALVGNPGAVGVVPRSLRGANIARQVGLVRCGNRLDARFLSAYLRSRNGLARLGALTYGSVQQVINLRDLRELRVPVPALTEQRAIADTLGALDDKIESNRRVTSTSLELADVVAAQAGARSTTDHPTTFGEFAEVFGGATPKTKVDEFWGGPHAWATPKDVTALGSPYLFDTPRTLTDAGLASCTAVLHPPGTVLMTSRATIGAFAVNQMPCAVNQGFIAVRPPADHDRWFLFHEMRRRVPEYHDNANGSTFLEISRGIFKALPLNVPPVAVRQHLHRTLDPIHRRAAMAAQETRDLAALRDALLPELLSGRLRVPEAREMADV